MSFRLVIDASAARTGGGAARVRQLVNSVPLLSPDLSALLIVGPVMQRQIGSVTRAFTTWSVPGLLDRAPSRLMWQQSILALQLRLRRFDWLLSPFSILPMAGIARNMHTAVIVSNIAPFAPEVLRDADRYQSLRLRALRRLILSSIRRADRVFLLSRQARNHLGSGVADERIVYLPMPPPPPELVAEALAVRTATGVGKPFFVAVGDLLSYKGLEDAIEAMSVVQRSMPARLLVCGRPVDSSYATRMVNLAHKTGAHVEFLGPTDPCTTLSLMHRSVATLACSRIENPNRVPSEAMTMLSPVIAADVPIAHEVCEGAALFYEPGDPASLATQMLAVATDEQVRQELVSRGRERMAGLDWLSDTRTILETMGLA